MKNVVSAGLLAVLVVFSLGATKDLGRGFRDHGVATPISSHRGLVCTVDGAGKNVVLAWLMDHRGGYELLMLDAATGEASEFPLPFKNSGDSPFASILSSGNKFYTHFDKHFMEFDPAKRAFTFCKQTTPNMSMGMTEDDNGIIWSVQYPQSAVVSFNPKTKELRDYGSVYKQNWAQYQRYVAADDQGWIYFAIGNTASQIIALEPKSGKATPLLAEGERKRGSAYLYRDTDGKVYGQALKGDKDHWIELYKGEAKPIGQRAKLSPKPIITDSQALSHATFPDGSKLKAMNLVDRVLSITDKDGKTRELPFKYTSDGAWIMGVAAAPDGTVSGGTSFPMRAFSYDPKKDEWTNRPGYGQFNTVAVQGDRFFVGGYGGGFLLEWDPSKPWVNTVKGRTGCNPLFLTDCTPTIHRPHDLLPTPDGKLVIMSGTPQYGYTGGGLLFWDRATGKRELLEHTAIIPEHSTSAMVLTGDGKLLCGTTTAPGTGGEKKATEAQLYIMDVATKKLEWQQVAFPGAQGYTDLAPGPDGLIYGIVDLKTFFVFDPAKREVVYKKNVGDELGRTAAEQGTTIFIDAGERGRYVLFQRGIVQIDPKTHALKLVAKSPVAIDNGAALIDGRIYFIAESHVYSYGLPAARKG